jgi:predicted tellurium resistance membrane protein TerC
MTISDLDSLEEAPIVVGVLIVVEVSLEEDNLVVLLILI